MDPKHLSAIGKVNVTIQDGGDLDVPSFQTSVTFLHGFVKRGKSLLLEGLYILMECLTSVLMIIS